MAKSLLVKDLKNLNTLLENKLNFIDIDYNVSDPGTSHGKTHTRSMITKNEYALLNGYRMWLQSKNYDYIRMPYFGGLFSSALNDRFHLSKDNEEAVADLIRTETEEKWPDINLLDCKVTANVSKREWLIRIVAQDKNTRLVLHEDDILIRATEEI